MAKITVELDAFYGFGCGFQSFGSDDTVEMEISEKELEALNKFGKEEITAEVFEAHANEIFDEAENRLHAQKAVLVKCLGP